MTQDETELFIKNIKLFQLLYPRMELELNGDIVSALVYDKDSMIRERKEFNISGYNYLYCITMLTKLLKEKLR